jgi:hypothetical protein
MLRKMLLGIGVLLLLLAAGLGALAGWRMIPAAVAGAVLVLAVLFERYIYKPIQTDAPGAGWDKTGEKFGDPRTGRNVTVWFNARTGERRYVADQDAGASSHKS